jgi:hypothetical protein
VAFNFVSPGWFGTYRTSLVAGRDFNTADRRGAVRTAIINEALRETLFAGTQAVGATIKAGPCGDTGCTVVGVVGNAVYGRSLRDGAPPTVYAPLAQAAGRMPTNAPLRVSTRTSCFGRSSAERRGWSPAVRLPVHRLRSGCRDS